MMHSRSALFRLISPVLALSLLAACHDRTLQPSSSITGVPRLETAKTVDVMTLQPQQVEKTIALPGEIYPYEGVDIYPKISGFIETLYVDRGSKVKRGQLLATLSAPELSSQISEAQAKVSASRFQRAEAVARYESEEETYQRLKGAAKTSGAISADELTTAQKRVAAAAAQISALSGNELSARAAVGSIRNIANYLRIYAPFDGVITSRELHPGALVGPSGSPIAHLEKISRLRLVVSVPEANVANIPAGMPLSFTVAAFQNKVFTGKVSLIAHSLDSKTRTEPVELAVENSSGQLSPGMYAEVQWPDHSVKPVFVVPPGAIVTTTERVFVIRVRHGLVDWVDVKRGDTFGNQVEVIGALQPGDQIVIKATDEIRPGSIVSTEEKSQRS